MDELAKRVAELAEKVGPQVMEAARAAVRVEAYSTLMSIVIWTIITAALSYVARYCWRYKSDDRNAYGDETVSKVVASFLMVIAAIFGLIALWIIIDPWTWVAISNPDLWLAKKVLKL